VDQSSLQTLKRYKDQEKDIGRKGMSSLYSNEFELYLVAFELVNSMGETEDYLVFPIMPDQIQKTENNRTNIKKSSTGTTVLFSQSFTPNDITIKGNFGRSFKLLSNLFREVDFAFAVKKMAKVEKSSQFDPYIKTGYGVTKILQNICKNSSKLDKWSKPYRMYFYNMALGESYLVVIPSGGLVLSQAMDTNMMWNYSLSMVIIADVEELKSFVNKSFANMSPKLISAGVDSTTLETHKYSTDAKLHLSQSGRI
jgi:hypothetical protein